MKQIVKKICIILLVVSMLFSFTACGTVSQAEKSVNDMFAAYKAMDFEKVKEYSDMGSFGFENSENDIVMSNDEFLKTIFEKLDYKIISSTKSSDSTVYVTTYITALDIQPVFSGFMTEAFTFFLSEENANRELSEDEIQNVTSELLLKHISQPDLQTKTEKIIIKVVKKDDKWKVASDMALADAITGGMISFTNQLQAAASASVTGE